MGISLVKTSLVIVYAMSEMFLVEGGSSLTVGANQNYPCLIYNSSELLRLMRRNNIIFSKDLMAQSPEDALAHFTDLRDGEKGLGLPPDSNDFRPQVYDRNFEGPLCSNGIPSKSIPCKDCAAWDCRHPLALSSSKNAGETIMLGCSDLSADGEKHLCTSCRAIRILPEDFYFPRFINEVVCRDSRCINDIGRCRQRHIQAQVLRQVGSLNCQVWRPETIWIRSCCDCGIGFSHPFWGRVY